mmetsp:Transcript_14024/g.29660  ORF Transcript_14024/g.29660 Transcript_14024/m.29660 type:complete len:336 (-) Transcript_14024:211-1218(-)
MACALQPLCEFAQRGAARVWRCDRIGGGRGGRRADVRGPGGVGDKDVEWKILGREARLECRHMQLGLVACGLRQRGREAELEVIRRVEDPFLEAKGRRVPRWRGELQGLLCLLAHEEQRSLLGFVDESAQITPRANGQSEETRRRRALRPGTLALARRRGSGGGRPRRRGRAAADALAVAQRVPLHPLVARLLRLLLASSRSGAVRQCGEERKRLLARRGSMLRRRPRLGRRGGAAASRRLVELPAAVRLAVRLHLRVADVRLAEVAPHREVGGAQRDVVPTPGRVGRPRLLEVREGVAADVARASRRSAAEAQPRLRAATALRASLDEDEVARG